MNPQRWIIGSWLGVIALATVRKVTDKSAPGLPPPSVYLGSGVLFTMLFGASQLGTGMAQLSSTLAVGTLVGAGIAPYLQGKIGPLEQLADFLGQSSTGAGSQPPAVTNPQAAPGPTHA